MKMSLKLLLIVWLSVLAGPALSEHLYGSVSLGNAAESDLSGTGNTASGMSYSVLFGFHINKNFAYEVGYVSLFSNANISNVTTKETLKGIEVAGVGQYPLNEQFSVFGRLGYANMDPSCSPGPLVENLVGFVYGVGAQYDISKQINVRAGYNIYNLSSHTADSIVNNAYASVLYNF